MKGVNCVEASLFLTHKFEARLCDLRNGSDWGEWRAGGKGELNRHASIGGNLGKPRISCGQKFQIFGVTNEASSQAMTAMPLPMER